MHYSTTTITSGHNTYVSTETLTPYEALSTTTVWGTGSYTVTVTKAGCGGDRDSEHNDDCPTSVTTTTETTADYYMPLAMYYTATTNNPFYRQLKPIVILPPKPHDSSYVETIGFGSVSLNIVSNSTAYRDLGFYYVFQNLASLNSFLPSGGSHTVTITGAGFTVNIWVNPGSLKWGPGPVPPMEVMTSSIGFASGTSGTAGTQSVSSSTTFHLTTAAGSCPAGGTRTISQLISSCGISASTPFALWIGIESTSVGTTSATVNSIFSSPYP